MSYSPVFILQAVLTRKLLATLVSITREQSPSKEKINFFASKILDHLTELTAAFKHFR